MKHSDLDDFAKGFLEAAMWANTSCYSSDEFFSDGAQEAVTEGTADGCLPDDADAGDVTEDAIDAIAAICAAFQRDQAALLVEAYARDYDEAQAGRDLYFTMAGHGVGYWDRDELDEGELGERISAVVPRREVNLYAEQSDEAENGFFIGLDI